MFTQGLCICIGDRTICIGDRTFMYRVRRSLTGLSRVQRSLRKGDRKFMYRLFEREKFSSKGYVYV